MLRAFPRVSIENNMKCEVATMYIGRVSEFLMSYFDNCSLLLAYA